MDITPEHALSQLPVILRDTILPNSARPVTPPFARREFGNVLPGTRRPLSILWLCMSSPMNAWNFCRWWRGGRAKFARAMAARATGRASQKVCCDSLQHSNDGKSYIHGDSDGAATVVFKGAPVLGPCFELIHGLDSTMHSRWKTCVRLRSCP